MSRIYAVHEAKAKLSEILRTVKAGRSVTISDRGRPVARVVPLESAEDLDGRIAELEKAGAILRRARSLKPVGTIARRPGALRRFLAARD